VSGDASHDPRGAVTIEALSIATQEDWTFGSFADDQVDGAGGAGCERDGDVLAALSQDHKGPVHALQAETFDVGTDCF
jgi:hypothetical protein